MDGDVELRCRCGKVHGWLKGTAPSTVNRMVCYCSDCQAFLHHLGRADLMDAHGGTEIVQVPPNSISYDRGTELIAGVRLAPGGMHRWYASCCKTPLGNTRTPALPFVGLPHEVLFGAPSPERRTEAFGPNRGAVALERAIGGIPEGVVKPKASSLLRVVWLLLGWKLSGKAWPHPFFERNAPGPKFPLTELSPAEREGLRSRCGPNPSV
ncbi:MAG TPA: DUF6151 family protein [Polyangiaceae bacterium]|nr:DUF6151 family protein [Polyangiaceae bacterium]